MERKFSQSSKLNQSQVIHLALQRALRVLQMPISELAEWTTNEIEKNPVLNLTSSSAGYSNPIEAPITDHPLHHLKQEIAIYFTDNEERSIAYSLLEYLNNDGFLIFSYPELSKTLAISQGLIESVAERISQLDPPGIAAPNLQQSLLIQLQCQEMQNHLAYSLIEEHFEDFISGKITALAAKKRLTQSQIKEHLRKIIPLLNFHPARSDCEHALPQTPDVVIFEQDGRLLSQIKNDSLPTFEVNSTYTELLETKSLRSDDRAYIRGLCAAGNWLTRMIERRSLVLLQIADYIIKEQKAYLENRSTLKPLTIKEASFELGLTISTLNRAIKDKTILTPQGLFDIRHFFSKSKPTIHQLIKDLVACEDKSKPLSDEKIAQLLHTQKIPCARRTVSKYRQALKIPPASKRRT